MQAEFKRAKCCISERPLADCEYMNVIQTDYIATWKYPVISNMLMKNDYRHAVAYIHDDYAPKKAGDKIPDIKFVIEFKDGDIIYHPVDTLQKGPRQFKFTSPCGAYLTSMHQAIISKQFFGTREVHFGPGEDQGPEISPELLRQTQAETDLIFQDNTEGTEVVIITRSEQQQSVAVYLMGKIIGNFKLAAKRAAN